MIDIKNFINNFNGNILWTSVFVSLKIYYYGKQQRIVIEYSRIQIFKPRFKNAIFLIL